MIFYENLENYIAKERIRLGTLHRANIPEFGVISQIFAANINHDKKTHDKKTDPADYSVTHPVAELEVDAQGIVGDRHRCHIRPSTGREYSLYPRGMAVRQHRHLLLVSNYDCKALSEKLGVEVTPQLLGANLVIEREDQQDYSLSELPPGTHMLVLPPDAQGIPKPPLATIVHYVKQQGCGVTGNAIAHRYHDQSLVKAFRNIAANHRGIVCSVEYPGESTARLKAGQKVAFRFSSAITP
ncbi:MAG: hypothetical protein VYA34_09230 [Myxococcota bacterium]|nr:hypothetical protein [Myxococcota bacterium]